MKRFYKKKIIANLNSYKKIDLNMLLNRACFSDLRFYSYIRYFFLIHLNLKGYKKNLNKVVYFCPKTNQTRGVNNFFRVYRSVFKDNALFAKFSGVKRSSW